MFTSILVQNNNVKRNGLHFLALKKGMISMRGSRKLIVLKHYLTFRILTIFTDLFEKQMRRQAGCGWSEKMKSTNLNTSQVKQLAWIALNWLIYTVEFHFSSIWCTMVYFVLNIIFEPDIRPHF